MKSTDLVITGMTCASCVARVEKKLNKLPGVTASVNLATNSARVVHADDIDLPQLISAVESAGYHAELPRIVDEALEMSPEESRIIDLRRRFLVSLILGIPVAILSMVPATQFRGWQWIIAAFAVPVITWGAWPFHRSAFKNALHLSSSMDTLVSLGIIAASAWSFWALFFGGAGSLEHFGMPMEGTAHLYFEVAVAVAVALLLGRWLEARAKRRSGDALRSLLSLGAPYAAVINADGSEIQIPAEDLKVGQHFRVRPGETVAADGLVLEGASSINESMLTGESVPVDVTVGSRVTGGTINALGTLVVQATAVGAQTRLAAITRLVVDAQSSKAPVQRLADRVSSVFVPVVLIISLGTLIGWLLVSGDVTASFTAAVAVLVIACPCALGLATPTALLVGTGRGAQVGILVTGPEVLEDTRRLDTILLDKTGTLTTGVMSVQDIQVFNGFSKDELLTYAGSLEHMSEHPIAKAISAQAAQLHSVQDFSAVSGQGVMGLVAGRRVLAGRVSFLQEHGVGIENADRGTVVAVAIDGKPAGVITVSDTIRDDAASAVAYLRRLGLSPWMVTGDTDRVAQEVAERVGINPSHVIAQATPEEKISAVESLQREGKVVAMIGDGINDAAALAKADVGIAMGAGTDAAMAASDLTLVRPHLILAADAIRLSRDTLRTIKGNLVWAFGYNVAAIPLAVAGLLDPMIAAFAMAFSSVFVVTNSLRLRRFKASV